MNARERTLADLRVGCGGPRPVRAPRGTEIACRGWLQEAALRMLCNNLDPGNAEDPDRLVVYGGTGKAARDWECFDAIVRSLLDLGDDESLLYNREAYIAGYLHHNRSVTDYFRHRPDDLLVLNVGDADAMQRLCGVLGVPYRGQQMPHMNRTA